VVVSAANHTPRARELHLDLSIDGEPATGQTVSLAAGEAREVAIEVRFDDEAEHRVVVAAPADGLEADNRAYLVARAGRRLPVTIVSDDDPAEAGTSAFYLSRALAPRGGEEDRFEVTVLPADRATPDRLAGASAVLVGYLGQLAPAPAEALVGYVRSGGGLAFFCGEGAVDRNLAALDSLGGDQTLLPWQPGPARVLPGADEALRITQGRWQSRLLAEFDEQSQVALGQVRFQRVWGTGAVHAEAQVLLTYNDGTPALGVRPLGLGTLAVANFSPSSEASDLGRHGAFVALAQVLAQRLRPEVALGLEPVVGAAYRHTEPIVVAEGTAPPSVVGPDDRPAPAEFVREQGATMLYLPLPRLPGFYRVEQAGQPLAVAAINLDPREGDLRRIDRQALLAELERQGLALDTAPLEGFQPAVDLRGDPLWGFMLAAAMAALGAELLCLAWWRR
jgi:hypothetical protein